MTTIQQLNSSPTFSEFRKIPRFSRQAVISEKIDGTNASVLIAPINKELQCDKMLAYFYGPDASTWGVWVGSRTRWITIHDDNFGFANWVKANLEDVKKLGPGLHFGEWYGRGIQRNYGLKDRKWALFNSAMYIKKEEDRTHPNQVVLPACIDIVPVLMKCGFDVINHGVEECISDLRQNGSRAVPGFMKPEGIVIYHEAGNLLFKKTIEKDESPKSIS